MTFKIEFNYITFDDKIVHLNFDDCYNLTAMSNTFSFNRQIDGQFRSYMNDRISDLFIEVII